MHSMTGYGRAQASMEGVAVVVEIQAVNKRKPKFSLTARLAVGLGIRNSVDRRSSNQPGTH